MTPTPPDSQGHLQYGEHRIWWEYYAERSGETVCLLNGLSMDTRIWQTFLTPLRSLGLGVLLFDYQGQGQSSAPEELYPLDAACHQLTAILDELAIDAVNVAGLSYGAFVGLEYCRLYPERVRSVLLTGAVLTEDRELRVFQDLSMRLFALGAPGLEVYAHHVLRKAYGREFLQRNRAFMMDLLPRHFFESYKDKISHLERLTASLDRLLCQLDTDSQRYAQLETAALFLAGSEDLLTPASDQRQSSATLPNGRFLELAGAGHLAWFERPEEFVDVLARFVRSPSTTGERLSQGTAGTPSPR